MKHVPQIDPNWPAAFKEPAFWDPCLAEKRTSLLKGDWMMQDARKAALLLSEGKTIAQAARLVNRTYGSLWSLITRSGGRQDFLARFTSNPSSQPAKQAAASAALPDGHASHTGGGREP